MSITHIHPLNSLMLRVADFSFSFHCPTVTVLVPGNNNSAFTSVMSLDSKTDVKQLIFPCPSFFTQYNGYFYF